MFEDIKKLRRLLKQQREAFIGNNTGDLTREGSRRLKAEIKWRRDEIIKDINDIGWLLMFIVVIPFALIEIGFSVRMSVAISIYGGFIICAIIIPLIIGRRD